MRKKRHICSLSGISSSLSPQIQRSFQIKLCLKIKRNNEEFFIVSTRGKWKILGSEDVEESEEMGGASMTKQMTRNTTKSAEILSCSKRNGRSEEKTHLSYVEWVISPFLLKITYFCYWNCDKLSFSPEEQEEDGNNESMKAIECRKLNETCVVWPTLSCRCNVIVLCNPWNNLIFTREELEMNENSLIISFSMATESTHRVLQRLGWSSQRRTARKRIQYHHRTWNWIRPNEDEWREGKRKDLPSWLEWQWKARRRSRRARIFQQHLPSRPSSVQSPTTCPRELQKALNYCWWQREKWDLRAWASERAQRRR